MRVIFLLHGGHTIRGHVTEKQYVGLLDEIYKTNVQGYVRVDEETVDGKYEALIPARAIVAMRYSKEE